jgi:hypothetical protein
MEPEARRSCWTSGLELKPRNGNDSSFGVQAPFSYAASTILGWPGSFLRGTYSIVDKNVWIFIAVSVSKGGVLQIFQSFRCRPW